MKVHVDPEICAGFRVCIGVSPEVFAMHDDGFAKVLCGDVPLELEEMVRTAASQCPSDAISITDE